MAKLGDRNSANQAPLSERPDTELKRDAKAPLRHMSPLAASEVVEEVMESPVVAPVIGFLDFVRERAVVGLALGFVIGTQVQAVASSIINNMLNPFVELLFSPRFLVRGLMLHLGSHTSTLYVGRIVYSLIDCLFVLLVLYVLIKAFKVDKLDKKK